MAVGLMDKLKGLNLQEDFIEIEKPAEEGDSRLLVQVERLQNFADADRVQRKLREGAVLLIKVRDLRTRDVSELRRALERIKRTCHAIDGDIAGLGEDWVLASGSGARLHRDEAA